MAMDYIKVAIAFGLSLMILSITIGVLSVHFNIQLDTLVHRNILQLINTVYMLLLIGCFIYVTNRRLKQYLNTLNQALHQLPDVDQQAEINYNGPNEFQKIFDSFNEISKQLHKSQLEQSRLSESKQRMLSDISHDLKTPVTTISGYSKALLDGMVSSKEQNHYLTLIYKKSMHLSELVDLFYEYSRLEHPDFQLRLQKSDFCAFLQNHLAQRYTDLEERKFVLEADFPEESIQLSFDRMQMMRAIDNLLNNSVKHNTSGTHITISLSKQEDHIILLFADNGCGIPKHLHSTLFDPFTTADSSRNHSKGSGLGLSITRKIIEQHGGQIELLQPDGTMQTRFQILLPLL